MAPAIIGLGAPARSCSRWSRALDDAAAALEIWTRIRGRGAVAARAGGRDVGRRFGLREGMRHPWLAAVDWAKLPAAGAPAWLARKPNLRPADPTSTTAWASTGTLRSLPHGPENLKRARCRVLH
ncbi:hypothetical protein B0H15DRAFT_950790 [Mycena belliarum]|uniref:Uncharacterized protein n=1 Tax=Mycena belliarum TaxID=1033014 RepID=A0AAD6XT69_9AGAR|nr:hypothetical protein B0H15DRAFT_950790 [Mycena belliae]